MIQIVQVIQILQIILIRNMSVLKYLDHGVGVEYAPEVLQAFVPTLG